MNAAAGHSVVRRGRFLAVAAITATAGMAAVEYFAPEQHFRDAAAVAEVDLRYDGSNRPTADQVRRRALSTANLSAVWRRRTGGSLADAQHADGDDSAAVLDRWRRQMVVEVRPSTNKNHVRIRFLIEGAPRDNDAAVLVEAVAAQYAGELAAEPWYALVDRLRAAEDRTDQAVGRLLQTVRRSPPAVSFAEPPVASPLPSETDQGDDVEAEIARLSRLRERLMESRTPAHPEVAALEARLNTLVAAVEHSAVRRLSADAETAPSLAAPLPTTMNASPTALAAADELEAARAVVRARLDDLTAPGAVEAPVVTTFDGAREIWELRTFWRIVACLPALVLASAAMRIARPTAFHSSQPVAVTAPTQAIEPATDMQQRVVSPPVRQTKPPRERRASPKKPDTTLDTLEQVAESVGAPVLAVVVRRREPRPARVP